MGIDPDLPRTADFGDVGDIEQVEVTGQWYAVVQNKPPLGKKFDNKWKSVGMTGVMGIANRFDLDAVYTNKAGSVKYTYARYSTGIMIPNCMYFTLENFGVPAITPSYLDLPIGPTFCRSSSYFVSDLYFTWAGSAYSSYAKRSALVYQIPTLGLNPIYSESLPYGGSADQEGSTNLDALASAFRSN
jgi:hypothetical protein